MEKIKKIFCRTNLFQKENIIFSVLFAAALVITNKIYFSGNLSDGNKEVLTAFHLRDLLCWLVIAAGVWLLSTAILRCLHDRRLTEWFGREPQHGHKRVFGISFGIIFVSWMLFFLTFFPGVGMNDSLYLMKMGFDLAGQHPPLYCGMIEGCMALGEMWGNLNYGIAFYVVMQILIMDLMVSYCILWFSKKGCPKGILIFFIVYFAGTSMIANYASAVLKDTLFGAIIMMWIPLLYDLVESRGNSLRRPRYCVGFALLSLATILLRNNGKYVYPALILILLFCIRQFWRQLLLFGAAIMMLANISDQVVEMNDMEPLFQESVAIPLQQMARVVDEDGVVTEKQKEFLTRLLPWEQYKILYRPYTVDTIKWSGEFDRDFLNKEAGTFLSTWAGMLKNNLKIYVDSYLLQTYGFWSVGTYSKAQTKFFSLLESIEGDRAEDDGVLKEFVEKNHISNVPIFPEKLQKVLENFYKKTSWYPGAGTCLWIILFIAVILASLKKYKKIVVLLPMLLVWGTIMISTPIAFGFRYVFMYAMCLPFAAVIPFLKEQKGNENG